MFRSKSELKERVRSLKMRVHNCEEESAYLRGERDKLRTDLTSPPGGYWLFTDAKMGVGAATFIQVFGTLPAARKYMKDIKLGQYSTLKPHSWAQIATLVDGRLIVLEEMVAMPTRPWQYVWINVKG